MLKTKWIEQKITYDGTQLRSLFAYLDHGVLGDSVVAFQGPCNIDFTHMVDGEDLLQQAKICGDDMLHFIIEIFDKPLFAGVVLQRLFASIAGHALLSFAKKPVPLQRSGDDLYVGDKKLSISIATRSVNSVLIHFAVNVTNAGTPVPTCALSDFGVPVQDFAKEAMQSLAAEFNSIVQATQKVRSV